MLTYEDFEKVDIRVGIIVEVHDFPEAKKPAYKMKIDFGSHLGMKWSSGQFTLNHPKKDLEGRQVLCVVNFPPKQVGPFVSEVLTLGVPGELGGWVAISPLSRVPAGGRLA